MSCTSDAPLLCGLYIMECSERRCWLQNLGRVMGMGMRWEEAVLDLCDNYFFFRKVPEHSTFD